MNNNEKTCALIYTGIATLPSGGVYPCCRMTKNSLYRGDISEYKDSDYYNNLVSTIESGEFPKECIRCKKEEDSGITSKRIRSNAEFSSTQEIKFLRFSDQMHRVDIRLSNLCNLGCVMCNPRDSSKIYDETINVPIESLPDHFIETSKIVGDRDLRTPYSDKDIEDIISMISPTSDVYITGGEPSLIKGVSTILNRLIESGYNETIELQFNSNFQAFNNKWVGLIKQFNGLMMPSIDAVGKEAEYYRYGTVWSSVEENVIRFLTECPKWRTKIFVSPSALNIFSLRDIFEWRYSVLEPVLSKGQKLEISTENAVQYPSCFSVTVLPPEVKKTVISDIDDIMKSYPLNKSELDHLEMLKIHIMKRDDSQLLHKTVLELDKIDKLRNMEWRISLDRFYNAIKGEL